MASADTIRTARTRRNSRHHLPIATATSVVEILTHGGDTVIVEGEGGWIGDFSVGANRTEGWIFRNGFRRGFNDWQGFEILGFFDSFDWFDSFDDWASARFRSSKLQLGTCLVREGADGGC